MKVRYCETVSRFLKAFCVTSLAWRYLTQAGGCSELSREYIEVILSRGCGLGEGKEKVIRQLGTLQSDRCGLDLLSRESWNLRT